MRVFVKSETKSADVLSASVACAACMGSTTINAPMAQVLFSVQWGVVWMWLMVMSSIFMFATTFIGTNWQRLVCHMISMVCWSMLFFTYIRDSTYGPVFFISGVLIFFHLYRTFRIGSYPHIIQKI